MSKTRQPRHTVRRKRPTKRARRSAAYLRTILDAALGAAIGMDADGRITDWNKRAEAVFGWTRGEAVGQKLVDTIIPPRHREAHERGLRRFLAGGEGAFLDRRIETTALRRDGTEFPVELAITPLKMGKSYVFSGFIADITERKRAEEAVRRSEERLRAHYNGLPVPTYTWQRRDADFVLVDYNRAAEAVTRGRIAQYLGASLRAMFADKPEVLEDASRCFTEQTAITRDMFHTLVTTGEAKDLSVTYVFVPPDLVTVYTEDVTGRKQTEMELYEREQQLWHILGEREALSQDLHDNIIQKIYAIGLNLEESKQLLAEDSNATVGNLERAIESLNVVIRDVRSYISGIDPGTLSAVQLQAELASLIQTSNGTGSLRFSLKLDPMASTRLNLEEAKHVRCIVQEAVSNSLRHADAKTGAVSLRMEGGRLCLKVEDDGIGFDASTARSSGNGLRNIAARAQKLGAQLRILSGPGQGTRLIIEFSKEHAGAPSKNK